METIHLDKLMNQQPIHLSGTMILDQTVWILDQTLWKESQH